MLPDYCRWNTEDRVKKLFQESQGEIDVLIEEGKCFFFAIKYGNVKMLKYLLDYYHKYYLLPQNRESMTYKIAQWRIRECLADILYRIDESKILPEIAELLKPFIETSDSSSDEDLDQMPDFYDADADSKTDGFSVDCVFRI